jgi:hypothetical protein
MACILSEKNDQRKIQEKRIAFNEDEIVLSEKWLVAFRSNSRRYPERYIFIRQFYAPGFFEAYDKSLTYAEKLKLSILWLKEKRRCGYNYSNSNHPLLESFCTYCNRKFNDVDPVPCLNVDCGSNFCSKQCMMDHNKMRHKIKKDKDCSSNLT